MTKRIALLVALFGVVGLSLASAAPRGYAWHDTPTGSAARLRGLSAVSSTTAWASGSLGTVLRTTDRGATWQSVGPPGTATLQFRDIEAFDANHAVIQSIGDNPTDFRIYVTADGGQSWTLTFVNQEPTAFYDCMTFFDARRGLAVSDPPDGQHFRVIATEDGGLHWHMTGLQMPTALPGEFAFAGAASASRPTMAAARGSAPAAVPRPVSSAPTTAARLGRCAPTPMNSGPSAGIFALRLPRPAARPCGRRRLPARDGVAGQLRADERRWRELEPPGRRALRVPLGRDLAEREHGARSRPLGERRQHGCGHDVAALRRRQPRYRRLREPERLLGLGRERPRRVPRALALQVLRTRP